MEKRGCAHGCDEERLAALSWVRATDSSTFLYHPSNQLRVYCCTDLLSNQLLVAIELPSLIFPSHHTIFFTAIKTYSITQSQLNPSFAAYFDLLIAQFPQPKLTLTTPRLFQTLCETCSSFRSTLPNGINHGVHDTYPI